MIYGVTVQNATGSQDHESLSYEDVLRIVIDGILTEDPISITIRRRCCSSLSGITMYKETIENIRRVAGVNSTSNVNDEELRRKLDVTINNWYLRGKPSLSEDCLVK